MIVTQTTAKGFKTGSSQFRKVCQVSRIPSRNAGVAGTGAVFLDAFADTATTNGRSTPIFQKINRKTSLDTLSIDQSGFLSERAKIFCLNFAKKYRSGKAYIHTVCI